LRKNLVVFPFFKQFIQAGLWVLLLLFLLPGAGLRAERAEDGERSSKKKWREYFGLEEKRTAEESSFEEELNPEGMIDLIDIPTTNVVDYGGYRLNFRLYSNGGVLTHLSFGVFRRLNIGASWDIEKAIGDKNLSTNVPTLFVRFRVYDGGQLLPSMAIGYNGQGRFFNHVQEEYKERERGLFAVFSRELLLPRLEVSGGANIAQFKEGIVLGFMAVSYTIEEKVVIMTEYDNIRKAGNNRFNAGIRIFPLSSMGIDFAVRNIIEKNERERIVRINYVGSF